MTSDAPRDWSGFPAVRKTLERWKLLEQGSAQEAVFEKLGVSVKKLAIQSLFPALAVAHISTASRPTCSSSRPRAAKASRVGCAAPSPKRWHGGRGR